MIDPSGFFAALTWVIVLGAGFGLAMHSIASSMDEMAKSWDSEEEVSK